MKRPEQVGWRSGGFHMPANTEGQVGWGSEQHDLVEGAPAHLRVVGLYDL